MYLPAALWHNVAAMGNISATAVALHMGVIIVPNYTITKKKGGRRIRRFLFSFCLCMWIHKYKSFIRFLFFLLGLKQVGLFGYVGNGILEIVANEIWPCRTGAWSHPGLFWDRSFLLTRMFHTKCIKYVAQWPITQAAMLVNLHVPTHSPSDWAHLFASIRFCFGGCCVPCVQYIRK